MTQITDAIAALEAEATVADDGEAFELRQDGEPVEIVQDLAAAEAIYNTVISEGASEDDAPAPPLSQVLSETPDESFTEKSEEEMIEELVRQHTRIVRFRTYTKEEVDLAVDTARQYYGSDESLIDNMSCTNTGFLVSRLLPHAFHREEAGNQSPERFNYRTCDAHPAGVLQEEIEGRMTGKNFFTMWRQFGWMKDTFEKLILCQEVDEDRLVRVMVSFALKVVLDYPQTSVRYKYPDTPDTHRFALLIHDHIPHWLDDLAVVRETWMDLLTRLHHLSAESPLLRPLRDPDQGISVPVPPSLSIDVTYRGPERPGEQIGYYRTSYSVICKMEVEDAVVQHKNRYHVIPASEYTWQVDFFAENRVSFYVDEGDDSECQTGLLTPDSRGTTSFNLMGVDTFPTQARMGWRTNPHARGGQGGRICLGNAELDMAGCLSGDYENYQSLAVLIKEFHRQFNASDAWGRHIADNVPAWKVEGTDNLFYVEVQRANTILSGDPYKCQLKYPVHLSTGEILVSKECPSYSYLGSMLRKGSKLLDPDKWVTCCVTGKVIKKLNAERVPLYLSQEAIRGWERNGLKETLLSGSTLSRGFGVGSMTLHKCDATIRAMIRLADEAWKKHRPRVIARLHEKANFEQWNMEQQIQRVEALVLSGYGSEHTITTMKHNLLQEQRRQQLQLRERLAKEIRDAGGDDNRVRVTLRSTRLGLNNINDLTT